MKIPFRILSGFVFLGLILFLLNLDLYEQYSRLEFEKYLRTHSYNTRPKLTKKEWKKLLPKKDRPDLAAEQDFFMTMDPVLKTVPIERLFLAYEAADISRQTRSSAVNWTEHGPNNIGGRTRAIMFDPNDENSQKFENSGNFQRETW